MLSEFAVNTMVSAVLHICYSFNDHIFELIINHLMVNRYIPTYKQTLQNKGPLGAGFDLFHNQASYVIVTVTMTLFFILHLDWSVSRMDGQL